MRDAVIPEGWSARSPNFPRIAEGDGVYRKVGSSSENQQGNQCVEGEQITVINPRITENSPMIPKEDLGPVNGRPGAGLCSIFVSVPGLLVKVLVQIRKMF